MRTTTTTTTTTQGLRRPFERARHAHAPPTARRPRVAGAPWEARARAARVQTAGEDLWWWWWWWWWCAHQLRITSGRLPLIGGSIFGEATADLQTAFTRPANRLAERGRPPWQDAGSALLRNEAVHTVLTEPQGVSCLVSFAQQARG